MEKLIILVMVLFLIALPMAFAWLENTPLGNFLQKLFGFTIQQPKISIPSVQDKPPLPVSSPIHGDSIQIITYNYSNINIFKFDQDINKNKFMNTIYKINPIYFDGVKELHFIYSNPVASNRDEDGKYFPEESRIEIYSYKDDAINNNPYYLRKVISHELAHHKCWINGYKWSTTEESHVGCFPKMLQNLLNG